MNNATVDEKIDILRKTCAEKGMRVTPQRIEIYKYVANSCEHPSAETIFEAVKKQMPNVSIDTVYRTLASLEELGIIFRVDNQLPKARFDADLTPHNHFLCIQCGEVYDIFPESYDLEIPKESYTFGQVKDANLQVRGICNKCLKANK